MALTCVATGNPQPRIMWFKDRESIPGEESELLIVPKVTVSDRGVYICTATNEFGSVLSQNGYLNILGVYMYVCLSPLYCQVRAVVDDVVAVLNCWYRYFTIFGLRLPSTGLSFLLSSCETGGRRAEQCEYVR